jgi:hypothetical protein
MLVNVGITLFLKLINFFNFFPLWSWWVSGRYPSGITGKKTNDSFHAVKLTERQGPLQKFKTPLAHVSGSLIADKAPILGLYLTYVDQDIILTLLTSPVF